MPGEMGVAKNKETAAIATDDDGVVRSSIGGSEDGRMMSCNPGDRGRAGAVEGDG